MSHFAKIENGIVVNVIVAEQDYVDGLDGTWVQTSYNTYGGVHYSPTLGTPDGGNALRKNYASVGFTYDEDRDAFIPPKPYPSWTLDEDTCLWLPPVPYPSAPDSPNNVDGLHYEWNEDTQSWDWLDLTPPE